MCVISSFLMVQLACILRLLLVFGLGDVRNPQAAPGKKMKNFCNTLKKHLVASSRSADLQ